MRSLNTPMDSAYAVLMMARGNAMFCVEPGQRVQRYKTALQ